MVLEFYYDLLSQPCRAVYLLLKVAGVDFVPVEVDLFKGEHYKPEFTKKNPYQKVPIIDDDGFILTERMAKTKVTARKLTVPTVCPLCKFVVKGDGFAQHVLACSSSRQRCDECGLTFRKATYLNQHKKRTHRESAREVALEDDAKEGKDIESGVGNSSPSSESSDWDSDPEIFLDDNNGKKPGVEESETGSSDNKNVISVDSVEDTTTDNRKVVDITSGRIIRKRTMPDPVMAPVKAKKVLSGEQVQKDERDLETDTNNNVTEIVSMLAEENPNYVKTSEVCIEPKACVEVQTQQVCETISKGNDSAQERENEDDVFGKHVANELRLIGNIRAKRYAKFQIQKLLFEAQEAAD